MAKQIPIVKNPNKVLRKIASEVYREAIRSAKTQKFISDMKETLKSTPDGVGLAASQVGEPMRIFIVSEEAEEIDKAEKMGWERRRKEKPEERGEKPYEERVWKYYVFINPVVKKISKTKLDGPEGCLSVPGKFGNVKRNEKITVEAYNESGKKFTRGASRFFARVMQHELDHLHGTLFIDKATGLKDILKDD